MSEDNQPQNKDKSFEELYGTALQQQKKAFQDEFAQKAKELAKKRLEATKVISSLDQEFDDLKANYISGLSRFTNV